ncbi:MAG TPA: hypothetical protein VN922_05185, partial [Bacteroidia bacterium]|nr:hypothetical protein [Bacteroidia bacterium]
ESNQSFIDILVDAMVEGWLTLGDDSVFTQKLKFPLTGELKMDSLTYKNRLTLSETQTYLQNVKTGDGDGRLLAYVCSLTSKGKAVLKNLDTEDYSVAQSIAVFFA